MTDAIDSDLSAQGVESYFQGLDPALSEAVRNMEAVETWTRDRYESVQAMLQTLADKVEYADINQDSRVFQSKLIVLLSYISSGKAIKLLSWIDQTVPNFVATTLAEAQMLAALDRVNEEAGRLFVERFVALERLYLLSRLFDEKRLEWIQRTLWILGGNDPEKFDERTDP
jgi:hypothetical protein